ncbi:MAG: hypothetical protein JW709_08200 [Sedimentisphaerales bacterium]|nr:hypothetical protein [Sedimentisphaerales bacterium]
MIEKRTVMILGAGASIPYGFPSGYGLLQIVCRCNGATINYNPPGNINTFHSLPPITDLVKHGIDQAKFQKFLYELEHSQVSIDQFIEHRGEEYYDLGRQAIAIALLRLENETRLFRQDARVRFSNSDESHANSWYQFLWSRMIRPKFSFDDFDQNKISFITFNYDRSLEHFLFEALKWNSGKTNEECATKLEKIDIVHVYGSLGPLPWQDKENGIPYQSQWHEAYRKSYANIDLMRSDNSLNNHFEKAHRLLAQAERIYILGFGFDPINLARLELDKHVKQDIIYATTQGLAADDLTRIKNIMCLIGVPVIKGSRKTDIYSFLYEHVILE